MSWVAVGVAAVTVVGGAISANQQKKGAQGAANAQIAEQQRQYDQTRADQLPFLQAGYGALDRQSAALNGDFSGFYNSPDYAFARQEMIQAGDRGAASRGGLFSGGYQADLATRINGLASQNFNNYWDRLRGMAGQGQGSAQNLASYGQQAATNIGNARASSYMANANANSQFATGTMGTLAGLYGNYMGQRQQQPQQGYSGPGWSYTGPTAATYGYTG